jgi:hypothetical protein
MIKDYVMRSLFNFRFPFRDTLLVPPRLITIKTFVNGNYIHIAMINPQFTLITSVQTIIRQPGREMST